MTMKSDDRNSVPQMYLDLADVDGDDSSRRSLWKTAMLSTTALGVFFLFNGGNLDQAFAQVDDDDDDVTGTDTGTGTATGTSAGGNDISATGTGTGTATNFPNSDNGTPTGTGTATGTDDDGNDITGTGTGTGTSGPGTATDTATGTGFDSQGNDLTATATDSNSASATGTDDFAEDGTATATATATGTDSQGNDITATATATGTNPDSIDSASLTGTDDSNDPLSVTGTGTGTDTGEDEFGNDLTGTGTGTATNGRSTTRSAAPMLTVRRTNWARPAFGASPDVSAINRRRAPTVSNYLTLAPGAACEPVKTAGTDDEAIDDDAINSLEVSPGPKRVADQVECHDEGAELRVLVRRANAGPFRAFGSSRGSGRSHRPDHRRIPCVVRPSSGPRPFRQVGARTNAGARAAREFHPRLASSEFQQNAALLL